MPRGRPRKTTPAPYIVINDQQVTWPFIKFVYKRLGCSWDDTIDAFWKARKATGSNGIYRYVMAGFKKTSRGIAYNTIPSKEREEGKMEKIALWWRKLYAPSEKSRATIAVQSADVKYMLESLCDSMTVKV